MVRSNVSQVDMLGRCGDDEPVIRLSSHAQYDRHAARRGLVTTLAPSPRRRSRAGNPVLICGYQRASQPPSTARICPWT